MVLRSMRRTIMVDVDGVIVVHPNPKGWSAKLQADIGVSPAALQQIFFKHHWEDVVHGRATLRERLGPVLAEIAPLVTCDRLIDYWFQNDAHLDYHLLGELEVLRSNDFGVQLATVQEHERAAFLWEQLDLRSRFDQIHYAAALGCSKPNLDFYRAVEARTSLPPEAMFLIDDREDNVTAARRCGWEAALWNGHKTVNELLLEIGWSVRQC
jgi:putative hydrolase of the HAD superfamily